MEALLGIPEERRRRLRAAAAAAAAAATPERNPRRFTGQLDLISEERSAAAATQLQIGIPCLSAHAENQ